MKIKTERCEIIKSNNRELKKSIDTKADKPFELPSVKLSAGQNVEDYMPAIKALFAHLMKMESSIDDMIFEIKVADQLAGYVRLVNIFGDKPELQVALLPMYWGQGYASEVLEVTIPYLFEEFGFEEMIWHVNPNNKASVKLALKLGAFFDEESTKAVGSIIETYIFKK